MPSPKPPSPPDPVAVSNAQAAANADTARLQGQLNRLNEVTPWGTVNYTELGPDQYQRTIGLNPQDQQQLDQMRALGLQLTGIGANQLGRVGDQMNTPWSWAGLPDAPTADNEARGRIEQALYSRLEPQFARDEEAMRTRLINQGHTEGSPGYNQAADELNRAKTDARMQAILAGGDEMARQFGLQQSARQQGVSERAYERGLPLSELGQLLSASPQQPAPNFGGIPQVGVNPTDVSGNFYNSYAGQLNNYNAKVGQQNAMMGGLFGLGGAALSSPAFLGWLSSRAAKDEHGEAEGILDKLIRLPVVRWSYKNTDEKHIGPMAEDFHHAFAVGDSRTISAIDAIGVCLAAIRELAMEVRAMRAS